MSYIIHHLDKARVISAQSEFHPEHFVRGFTRKIEDVIKTELELEVFSKSFYESFNTGKHYLLSHNENEAFRNRVESKTLAALKARKKTIHSSGKRKAMDGWLRTVFQAVIDSRESLFLRDPKVVQTFNDLIRNSEKEMRELKRGNIKLALKSQIDPRFDGDDIAEIWNEIIVEQTMES